MIFIPRIAWVMDVRVGPFVGKDDRAIRGGVGECVEDVGEGVGLDRGWGEFTAVNAPVHKTATSEY